MCWKCGWRVSESTLSVLTQRSRGKSDMHSRRSWRRFFISCFQNSLALFVLYKFAFVAAPPCLSNITACGVEFVFWSCATDERWKTRPTRRSLKTLLAQDITNKACTIYNHNVQSTIFFLPTCLHEPYILWLYTFKEEVGKLNKFDFVSAENVSERS